MLTSCGQLSFLQPFKSKALGSASVLGSWGLLIQTKQPMGLSSSSRASPLSAEPSRGPANAGILPAEYMDRGNGLNEVGCYLSL